MEPEPVAAEVARGQTCQDVERRAAFAGRGNDLAHVGRRGRGEDLDNLGMIAPARVPQVMIVDSFHHMLPSPRLTDEEERRKVGHDHRDDRGQPTSTVSGCSKSMWSALP